MAPRWAKFGTSSLMIKALGDLASGEVLVGVGAGILKHSSDGAYDEPAQYGIGQQVRSTPSGQGTTVGRSSGQMMGCTASTASPGYLYL